MAEVVVIGTAPSRDMYDEVGKAVDGAVPDGLIIHTATQLADGKIRIIDIWESREAADAFGEKVIGPAVERLMASAPGEAPEPEVLEPFEVMRP
jgi:hypothetical protein